MSDDVIRFTLSDECGYDSSIFLLGVRMYRYFLANVGRSCILPGVGVVGHGPAHRSIKIKFRKDTETYNYHDITVHDKNSEEEKRIASEIRNIYKDFNFSQVN